MKRETVDQSQSAPISTESVAWQLFSLALMMRDAFRFYGGELPGDLTLTSDERDAIMSGLFRLAEMARTAAFGA